jgi:predicted RNA-binding Zn ribbon-like protein
MDQTSATHPQPARTAGHLHRHGGALCLDFVNTATWDGMTILREHVHDAQDADEWAAASGFQIPVRGAANVDEVRAVRASCRQLLLEAKPNDAHAVISRASEFLNSAALGPRPLPLRWQPTAEASRWIFGPIALSALEIVTGPAARQVRTCDGDGCGWMFLDRSRSHRRRWCAMEPCGNRIKARSFADRRRRASRAADGSGAP